MRHQRGCIITKVENLFTLPRIVLLASAALTAFATPAEARSASKQEAYENTAQESLQTVRTAIRAHDCARVMATVDPLVQDERFASLPEATRKTFLELGLSCFAQANKRDKAREYALKATALDEMPYAVWQMRFLVQLDTAHLDDAVTTLERMQDTDPAWLTQLNPDAFSWLTRQVMKAPGSDAYTRFLALVCRDDFLLAQTSLRFDTQRLAYALALARSGAPEAARVQLGKLRRADALRDASLERALKPLLPADFQYSAALKTELEALHSMEQDNHFLLSTPIAIARAQRMLGDAPAAIATLEAARPYGTLRKMFTDRGEELNWWWDGLARSYEQLGRYDDAVAAYRQAIAEGENAGSNVSQVINLAYFQSRFGHPTDALETLQKLDIANSTASPYGIAEYHLVRGCAAQAAGDTTQAMQDLAYLAAHPGDHPEALGDLFLCLHRDDDAAKVLIARLLDPKLSLAARVQMSQYRPLPANVPADPIASGLKRLAARADVQAALSRAGGIGHFDVLPGGL